MTGTAEASFIDQRSLRRSLELLIFPNAIISLFFSTPLGVNRLFSTWSERKAAAS